MPILVMDLQRAIGTKDRSEKVKPAKKPSKASAAYTDEKGRKRYKYKGQKPDAKGGVHIHVGSGSGNGKPAPKAAPQAAPAAPPAPAGPPPINVEELATALRLTTATLEKFAQRFSSVEEFKAHMGRHARDFIRKHNIGSDKLRRLFETLTRKPAS
jgi:hypothetical protein